MTDTLLMHNIVGGDTPFVLYTPHSPRGELPLTHDKFIVLLTVIAIDVGLISDTHARIKAVSKDNSPKDPHRHGVMSITLLPVGSIPAVDSVMPNISTAAAMLALPITESISSQPRTIGGRAKPPTSYVKEDDQGVY